MSFQLIVVLFFNYDEKNSVNGNIPKIPYPWLVFNGKVKVNAVFLRDSTGISDSVLLLFGGNISRGGLVRSFHFFASSIISSHWIECFFTNAMALILNFSGWSLENVGRIL